MWAAEDKLLYPLGKTLQPQAFPKTGSEESLQTESRVGNLLWSQAGFSDQIPFKE